MAIPGTLVILYGTVVPAGPISSYSIDNGIAFVNSAPIKHDAQVYQQPLYETSGLKPGEHSLTMTVESTEQGMYWIDYALVS